MKIYYNIEQGTDEWLDLRKKRLTASHATAIAANGAGLKTYVKKKVLSLINENQNRFYGKDMERGDILEPIARVKYEFEKNISVLEVGFVAMNEWCGYSPDGLIGDTKGVKLQKDGLYSDEYGLAEIKARNDEKHLELLYTEKIDTGTIWQMQMGMLITKRRWCDFISYNPNFKNSLYVKRVYRDEVAIEKLKKGIESGTIMLKTRLDNKIIKEEISHKINAINVEFQEVA